MFLFSQGDSNRVGKGKKFLGGGLIGILIVFFAYIGVQTISMAITTGELAGTGGYAVCDGTNEGDSCALNRVCDGDNWCVDKCERVHGDDVDSFCALAGSVAAGGYECSDGTGLCNDETEVCCK